MRRASTLRWPNLWTGIRLEAESMVLGLEDGGGGGKYNSDAAMRSEGLVAVRNMYRGMTKQEFGSLVTQVLCSQLRRKVILAMNTLASHHAAKVTKRIFFRRAVVRVEKAKSRAGALHPPFFSTCICFNVGHIIAHCSAHKKSYDRNKTQPFAPAVCGFTRGHLRWPTGSFYDLHRRQHPKARAERSGQ